MRSVFIENLTIPENVSVDTEIQEVSLKNGNFILVFDYWPDEFGVSPQKRTLKISIEDCVLNERIEAANFVGYDVQDIYANESDTKFIIDSTIRRIEIDGKRAEFSEVGKSTNR